ncbi:cellulose synthase operon protein YhjQ/BcsQ [Sneathiella chinensis]|uniref:Response regulatory domain-containing protein n=1 Tax=Sneathiella chinensis TaxID=349750 RepID=A0ABQ5U5K3_9PROT|nr:cellulose synthase operon protein YhjQ/BcsQ [Sneathiella chinensis]GLQ06666.1 hypothetical protein GCM10007924_18870 [Sneathiella chinensis]
MNSVAPVLSVQAPLTVTVFASDRETMAGIRTLLSGQLRMEPECRSGNVTAATAYFARNPSPDVLIVDISGVDLPLSHMNELAKVCAPDVKVIAIGDRDAVGLYRNLLDIGVQDYLVTPVPADILHRAILRATRPDNQSTPSAVRGKIVSVLGASGGAGVTSILSLLGLSLSGSRGRRVMIVDLDAGHDGVGGFFKQEPEAQDQGFLQSPERIDQLYLDRVMRPVTERLHILSSRGSVSRVSRYGPEMQDRLTSLLENRYHFLFMDFSGLPISQAVPLVAKSDIRLILCQPTVPAARQVDALLKAFNGNEVGKELVLLNRCRPGTSLDVPVQRLEAHLDRQIDGEIPFDGAGFAAQGVYPPDLSRLSARTQASLNRFADLLTGEGRRKATGMLGRIREATRHVW